jgi:DNA-binding MarR family transcriptional regulator
MSKMKLTDSFIFSINKLNRAVVKDLDRALAKGIQPVNHSQLFILMAIHENPDNNITVLSKVLGCDMTTVGRSAEDMCKLGFVVSQPNENDGRSYTLSISKKGLEVIHHSMKTLEDIDLDSRSKYG